MSVSITELSRTLTSSSKQQQQQQHPRRQVLFHRVGVVTSYEREGVLQNVARMQVAMPATPADSSTTTPPVVGSFMLESTLYTALEAEGPILANETRVEVRVVDVGWQHEYDVTADDLADCLDDDDDADQEAKDDEASWIVMQCDRLHNEDVERRQRAVILSVGGLLIGFRNLPENDLLFADGGGAEGCDDTKGGQAATFPKSMPIAVFMRRVVVPTTSK